MTPFYGADPQHRPMVPDFTLLMLARLDPRHDGFTTNILFLPFTLWVLGEGNLGSWHVGMFIRGEGVDGSSSKVREEGKDNDALRMVRWWIVALSMVPSVVHFNEYPFRISRHRFKTILREEATHSMTATGLVRT